MACQTPKDSVAVAAFQKWVHSFMEKILAEVNKDDNRRHIHSHVVVPLLHILYKELYPYIVFVLVILMFILMICVAVLFFVAMLYYGSKPT
jgi:hypothetical protein